MMIKSQLTPDINDVPIVLLPSTALAGRPQQLDMLYMCDTANFISCSLVYQNFSVRSITVDDPRRSREAFPGGSLVHL